MVQCLDKAKELAEVYRMEAHHDRSHSVSMDEVLRLVCTYLNKDVQVQYFLDSETGDHIRGVFFEVTGKYEIYLLDGMSLEWIRFVLCKELFHVLLDEDGCRNCAVDDHLREMIPSFSDLHSHPGSPVVWEVLAEIAAAELMFPFADRVVLMTQENVDTTVIAQRYSLPVLIVERYLSDNAMQVIASHMA